MHQILNRNLFFVKEHVGMFKAANNYDVIDPETQEPLMECREENLGILTKIFRFTDYKRMTPFNVTVKAPDGTQLVRVQKKGVSFFTSEVHVFDEKDICVGKFKQKFFSMGGAFHIFDMNDQPICKLQGKWTSWDFKFICDQRGDVAHVSKKWAGMGKELFTTADNYMLEIYETLPKDDSMRTLIIAAVMCIDMVIKE